MSHLQEIATEEKALGELRRKSEGLVKRAEALQAQVDGAGGEKLRKQRALCEKLQEVGRMEGDVRGVCGKAQSGAHDTAEHCRHETPRPFMDGWRLQGGLRSSMPCLICCWASRCSSALPGIRH